MLVYVFLCLKQKCHLLCVCVHRYDDASDSHACAACRRPLADGSIAAGPHQPAGLTHGEDGHTACCPSSMIQAFICPSTHIHLSLLTLTPTIPTLCSHVLSPAALQAQQMTMQAMNLSQQQTQEQQRKQKKQEVKQHWGEEKQRRHKSERRSVNRSPSPLSASPSPPPARTKAPAAKRTGSFKPPKPEVILNIEC